MESLEINYFHLNQQKTPIEIKTKIPATIVYF